MKSLKGLLKKSREQAQSPRKRIKCVLESSLCKCRFSFISGKYLGVRSLGYVVCLTLQETTKILSKRLYNFAFFLRNVKGFQLLHAFTTSTWYCQIKKKKKVFPQTFQQRGDIFTMILTFIFQVIKVSSMFSCAYLPCVCHLWQSVLYPFFKLGFFVITNSHGMYNYHSVPLAIFVRLKKKHQGVFFQT